MLEKIIKMFLVRFYTTIHSELLTRMKKIQFFSFFYLQKLTFFKANSLGKWLANRKFPTFHKYVLDYLKFFPWCQNWLSKCFWFQNIGLFWAKLAQNGKSDVLSYILTFSLPLFFVLSSNYGKHFFHWRINNLFCSSILGQKDLNVSKYLWFYENWYNKLTFWLIFC